LKAVEAASTVMKCEATEATNAANRCTSTSDDTESENYGLRKNQTPDLCYCKHNHKTPQKMIGNFKYLQQEAVY